MPIRPICITGEPVLHSVAKEVTDFDDDLRQLVDDMFLTMDAAPGVGLAAPQAGAPLRLFVYTYDDEGDLKRGVVINPELWIEPLPVREPDEDDDEGCLSVPGERFPIVRSERARVTGVDLDQNPISIDAEGWFARIMQHEFDHLNGVLYVDRLEHPHSKSAQKAIRRNSWGSPGQTWLPGTDELDA